MRTLFSILALLAGIIAIILAILPLENLALIPAVIALIFVVIAFLQSKNEKRKFINFTFVITVIAFALILFKYVFAGEPEVKIDQEFIEKNQQSEEKAIEELEDLEELNNFEDSDSIN